jgi:hypothetical protein
MRSRSHPHPKAIASPNAPYQDLIRFHKTEGLNNRYDVDMQSLDRLRPFHQLECHVVVYPYARTICSDDIHFNPFEEYVQDVLSHQRSAYSEIPNSTDQLFGLLLGLLIAAVFAVIDPDSLLSVEALVSVFGAYVVAKELWNDLEHLLINATKNWRLRYQESYFRYQLEKRTTLTSYSYLAKRRRYGKQAMLPAKIDFIKQSNSQTLRMCFDVRDLSALGDSLAHLFSIQIAENRADAFRGPTGTGAFMLGVKLSFDRRLFCLRRSFEVFQSIDAGRKGCLDGSGAWQDGAAFFRQTVTLGRLKFYARQGLIPNATLVAT